MAVWNNATVQNVGGRARNNLSDFQKFILRGNVVDLAVGIMIGAAFSGVVNALVADIITPLIPISSKGLSGWTYKLPYPGGGTLLYGPFINTVITFLILAFVIYFFIVKPINRLMALHKPKAADAATTRDCPYCLSTIPLQATRCAYCTAQLPPADQAAARV
ncbi:MAG: large conductance mechanosensitive channel protein MscL [Chloroflexota bacterium]|nr:large conductance mechanosensitive channel protein MscL [Chloroflexota bacterium]